MKRSCQAHLLAEHPVWILGVAHDPAALRAPGLVKALFPIDLGPARRRGQRHDAGAWFWLVGGFFSGTNCPQAPYPSGFFHLQQQGGGQIDGRHGARAEGARYLSLLEAGCCLSCKTFVPCSLRPNPTLCSPGHRQGLGSTGPLVGMGVCCTVVMVLAHRRADEVFGVFANLKMGQPPLLQLNSASHTRVVKYGGAYRTDSKDPWRLVPKHVCSHSPGTSSPRAR